MPVFWVYLALIGLRYASEAAMNRGGRKVSPSGEGSASLLVMIGAHFVSVVSVGVGLRRGAATGAGHVLPGLALLTLGYVGRLWALRTMGRSYHQLVTPRSDGRLVTDGPYRAIRHPLYLFYLLEMVGLLVAAPSLLPAVALGAVALAVLARIPIEESLLEAAYGEAWRAYRRGTRRLIPLAW